MNFFTVITLYPAVTMVYEYYMKDAGDAKGCCKSTCHCLKSEKGYTRASGMHISNFDEFYSSSLSVCVSGAPPWVDRCGSVEGARRPSWRVRARIIAPSIHHVLSAIPQTGFYAFREGEVSERQRTVLWLTRPKSQDKTWFSIYDDE